MELGTRFEVKHGIGRLKVNTSKQVQFSWQRKLNENIKLITAWSLPWDLGRLDQGSSKWDDFSFVGARIEINE